MNSETFRHLIWAISGLAVLAMPTARAGAQNGAQSGAQMDARVNPRFQNLWLEHGLPDKTVRTVVQDAQGFIWLGTTHGLSRFDGTRLETFVSDPQQPGSLSNDRISALHSDVRGRLWIATRDGLNRYIPSTREFETHRHDAAEPRSLSSSTVLALEDADSGGLWVGTSGGLDRLDAVSGTVERFGERHPGRLDVPVRTLHRDAADRLWVGTAAGLVVREPSGEVRRVSLGIEADPVIRAVESDPDGVVWIGTQDRGLLRFEPSTRSVVREDRVTDPMIFSLTVDPAGSLWVGTREEGLYRRSADGDWSHYRYDSGDADSLRDNSILALYVDRSNTLWAGSFQAGVHRLSLRTLAFGRHDNGRNSLECLPSPVTNDLHLADPNTLVVATQLGLAIVDRRSGECEVYRHDPAREDTLSSSTVLTVHVDDDGTVWAGTLQGLDRVAAKGRALRIEVVRDVPVYSLARTAGGPLLVGTTDGLFQSRGEVFEQVALADSIPSPLQVNSIAFDRERRAWLGTNRGLLRWSLDSGGLDPVQHDGKPFLTSWIGAVHVDAEGTIWAGVDGDGLYALPHSGETWEPMRHGSELPDFPRFGTILSDATGDLWVATPKGLFRIDPAQRRVSSFRASDGLQSDDFIGNSFFRSRSGRFLLGGRLGFNVFDPADIELDTTPPQVSLTGFLHFNEPAEPGVEHRGFTLPGPIDQLDAISLSHRDDVVGFEFAALHYSDPSRNRYAYRLRGFDGDWVPAVADRAHATYTNLDPGDYVFEVRAANPHGVWNEDGASLRVEVLPAPWATWWAYTTYAALVVTATICFFLYRTTALRRRALDLEHSVRERTETIEALLAAKNEELANLSHEFRTPLTLMLGPAKRLLRSTDEPEIRDTLSVIRRNGIRLLRMVDQLLHMEKFKVQKALPRRPQAVAQTIRSIGQSFQELAAERDIHVRVEPVEDLRLTLVPDTLEKILLNLLSNAIKYTPAGGRVEVSAVAEAEQARIEVRDTGIGIPPEHQAVVFERYRRLLDEHEERVAGAGIGLALVKELAEAHGGSIELQSAPGEGSVFTLGLPLPAGPQAGGTGGGPPAEELDSDRDSDRDSERDSELLELELASLASRPGESAVRPSRTVIPSSPVAAMEDDRPSVLVIEDNPDMMRYVAETLSERYACLTAAGGHEGLLLAWEHVPDLIVSDVMMPGMDGYQVLSNLKDDDRSSHIPVILLTARGDRKSRHRGWQERADEYLTKPFDEEELLLRVHNLLEIREILRQRFGEEFAPGAPGLPELGEGLNPRDREFLDRFRKMIDEHFPDPEFRLAQMTAHLALSERPLQRKLKALLGRTPIEYLRAHRLARAGDLLQSGLAVGDVAHRTGFSSQSYFATCFKAQYGVTPSEFGDRAA